jgi:hypothetical protein
MWQVVNPVYWWAAGALLLPLVIHLYNQRSTRVKQLGTLRWLREVQPAQANFRRIQQWPLLIVRMLLVLAVVLLLVEFFWETPVKSAQHLRTLILIHPQAGDSARFRQLAERWQNDSVHVRWLSGKFPLVTDAIPVPAEASVWSLVTDAARHFPADSIHIIAPNRADYFAGKPVALAQPLSWELTEWQKDTVRLLQAVATGNEPELLWFRSGTQLTETTWRSEKTDRLWQWTQENGLIKVTNGSTSYEVPVRQPDTLAVAALYGSSQADAWRLLRTALQAVASFHRQPMRFTENARLADWLIVMDGKQPAANFDSLSLVIRYQLMESAAWLEPLKADSVIIRKELTTKHILEGGLLQAMRPYLLEFKSRKAAMPAVDFRQVDWVPARITEKSAAALAPPNEKPTDTTRVWLGMITLGLLALERLWPKQTT